MIEIFAQIFTAQTQMDSDQQNNSNFYKSWYYLHSFILLDQQQTKIVSQLNTNFKIAANSKKKIRDLKTSINKL